MIKKLIKIDRNGSKHYEGHVTCDRCGGDGMYKWGAVINGNPQYVGVCYKCAGAGVVWRKWIERTPEYQAKLDARREAKHKAEQEKREAELAKREAERAAIEAKRKAEREEAEARRKAEAAISQYVGKVGERLTMTVTYLYSARFEVASFRGRGTDIMYVHNFKDADGNKLIWTTGTSVHADNDTQVKLTGTVKAHSTYRDEKQTSLTRCKVQAV